MTYVITDHSIDSVRTVAFVGDTLSCLTMARLVVISLVAMRIRYTGLSKKC